MKAHIINNYILIKNNYKNFFNKIYVKNFFGKLYKDGLKLTFFEAIFLFKQNKISILKENELLTYGSLLEIASSTIQNFDILFLLYSELKIKGYFLKYSPPNSFFVFSKDISKNNTILHTPTYFLKVIKENSNISLSSVQILLKKIKKNSKLIYCVIDDEFSIIYYSFQNFFFDNNITPLFPSIYLKNKNEKKIQGILLDNSVVISNKNDSTNLHDQTSLGFLSNSFLHLSLLESLFLQQNNIISIFSKRNELSSDFFLSLLKKKNFSELFYNTFFNLLENGILVKSGFKYGSNFRLYTNNNTSPSTHALYLLSFLNESKKISAISLSKIVRLSTSVKKKILFYISPNTFIKCDYLSSL